MNLQESGGTGWITNGAITATADEIRGDILSLLKAFVRYSDGGSVIFGAVGTIPLGASATTSPQTTLTFRLTSTTAANTTVCRLM